MNYNISYKIGRIGVGIGFFLVLLSLAVEINFISYIGFFMIIGSALLETIFYRCPNCNESLSTRGKKPRHCPGCGYKLDD